MSAEELKGIIDQLSADPEKERRVREFLAGRAIFVSRIVQVDCTSLCSLRNPAYPKVVNRSTLFGMVDMELRQDRAGFDQLYVAGRRVVCATFPEQNAYHMRWPYVRDRLEAERMERIPDPFLDALLQHIHLIPKAWCHKGEQLVFWGTEHWGRDGGMVRALVKEKGNYGWLPVISDGYVTSSILALVLSP